MPWVLLFFACPRRVPPLGFPHRLLTRGRAA